MPTTEVPPNQAPPEPPSRTRRNRYEDLDADNLLHVIEDLEDRQSWGRVREMIWISIIIHLLILWYLIYGPKYIYHVHVVDPSVVLKQQQKNLTYLELPQDALKNIKPKPTNVISDKNRVAESKNPTLDRKTLEQLEAMRRAGPKTPAPAPQRSQQQPSPQQAPSPAQQQAQAAPPRPQQQVQQAPQPPAPPAQPLPNNSQAQLEAPKPAPTTPNFRTGAATPTDQLQQALRQATRGGFQQGQYGGDDGLGAPSRHQGMQGAVDILSDTMGVDFSHYIQQVVEATKRAWYPIIPEEARPPLNKQGRVMIRFKIYPDGSVKQMILEGPSGDVALDRAAWGGITGAAPFPQLPRQFKGPYLELRFYFLYNIQPGSE
jgi:TonB family protein